MLRDYFQLPLAVRILCVGSLINRAGSCIAIWTLGEILQAPFKQSIVTDMAPENLRGIYLGMFTMCYASALTIGAPIGGEVLQRLGPTMLWMGTFLTAMVAVTVYLLIHPTVTRRVAVKSDASRG